VPLILIYTYWIEQKNAEFYPFNSLQKSMLIVCNFPLQIHQKSAKQIAWNWHTFPRVSHLFFKLDYCTVALSSGSLLCCTYTISTHCNLVYYNFQIFYQEREWVKIRKIIWAFWVSGFVPTFWAVLFVWVWSESEWENVLLSAKCIVIYYIPIYDNIFIHVSMYSTFK